MKKILLILILIQGVLMSSVVESIKVKGVDIPFVFESDNNLPIVSMQFVFKNSGSLQDGELEGLARLSAKILNEGTKKLGSTEFAKKLENNAIGLGISTGKETFVITVSCLKEKIDLALGLLNELLQDPNFSEDSLKKIKYLTMASISKNKTNYDYIAGRELKKLIFANTPMANGALGTENSIKKIGLNEIKEFIKTHIVLNKALIVGGGDIKIEDIKAKSAKILDLLEVGKSSEVEFISGLKNPNQKIIYKKEVQQAYIYFGTPFNLKYDDKDVYKAKVANFILGGSGFGSRLMEEVRVKHGLAYSIYCRISLAKSHSLFSGYLQTKLESQDKAKAMVERLINDFVKDGVTKEELESAKKFLLGSEPLRNETLGQRVGRSFDEYYKGFKLGHSKKMLKKIEKLTLKELNDFIKAHSEIKNLSFSMVTKK